MNECETRSSEPELRAAERTARAYVLSVIMPLWIASGSIDYVLHRRSHIEKTSGSYESKLHVLGLALASIPVLAGLVLEINAGVILLMGVGYVTHLGMTVWDVAYADKRRTIVPLEQHVHAMLELLPFTALSFVVCTYREQALALIGRGSAQSEYALMRKRNPLRRQTVITTVVAFGVFVALPFAEELLRCLHYERSSRRPAVESGNDASR